MSKLLLLGRNSDPAILVSIGSVVVHLALSFLLGTVAHVCCPSVSNEPKAVAPFVDRRVRLSVSCHLSLRLSGAHFVPTIPQCLKPERVPAPGDAALP